MPFIGNAGQFSNIYEKNYTTDTLRIVEGDSFHDPVTQEYNLITTLENITAIGNTSSNTVQFTNANTSCVTSSNVGIANTSPIHTLDVGSNVYIDDARSSNVLHVRGNVYSAHYKGGNVTVTGTVYAEHADIDNTLYADNIYIDTLNPRNHQYITSSAQFGLSNAAPTKTISVGDRVHIDTLDSNALWVSTNVYANFYKGGRLQVSGPIEANEFIVTGGGSLSAPSQSLQSVSEVLGGFTSDRTMTLSNVTTGLIVPSNINAVTVLSNIHSDNVASNTISVSDTIYSNNVVCNTFSSNTITTPNIHGIIVYSNVVSDNISSNVITISDHVDANNLICNVLTSNIINTHLGELTIASNLVVENVFSSNATVNVMVVNDTFELKTNKMEIGTNNTLGTEDVGIICHRPSANVALFYDESSDLLEFAYTASHASNAVIAVASTGLNANLTGQFTCASIITTGLIQSGTSISAGTGQVSGGLATFTNDLTVGTNKLFVDVSTSRVGVLTLSPSYTLDVNGTANVGALTATSVSTGASTGSVTSGTGTFQTVTIDTSKFVNSKLGVNTTSPGYTLDVSGDINFTGSLTNSGTTVVSSPWLTGTNTLYYSSANVGIGVSTAEYELHVVGNIYASGTITELSDARFKENVIPIENALDKVCSIGGYTYNKIGSDEKMSGVIAQEVANVLPEVVRGSEDTNYSVSYGNMVGLLIEAIKELKSEIDELKKSK